MFESFISKNLQNLIDKLDGPKTLRNEEDETDYDLSIDDSISISNRIIHNRNLGKSSGKDVEISRKSDKTNVKQTRNEELIKISQFLDVNNSINALNSIESLMSDPNITLAKFEKNYIESSLQLLQSIYQYKSIGNEFNISKTKESQSLEDKSEIIVKILDVSFKIFQLSINLIKPLLIHFYNLWQSLSSNEWTNSIFKVFGEIVLVVLLLILHGLQKLYKSIQ